MGGRASKQKGDREERAVVHSWQCAGFSAHRVPLSGAVKGYPGDVMIDGDREYRVECKHRENISKQLWEWLDDNDLLTLRRNHYPRLVVMLETEAQRLLQDAASWRSQEKG